MNCGWLGAPKGTSPPLHVTRPWYVTPPRGPTAISCPTNLKSICFQPVLTAEGKDKFFDEKNRPREPSRQDAESSKGRTFQPISMHVNVMVNRARPRAPANPMSLRRQHKPRAKRCPKRPLLTLLCPAYILSLQTYKTSPRMVPPLTPNTPDSSVQSSSRLVSGLTGSAQGAMNFSTISWPSIR